MQSLKTIIIILIGSLLVYVGFQLQNPSGLNVKSSSIVCLLVCILLACIAPLKNKRDHIKFH
ncbi:MAG: hypothetical protein ABI402_05210 [Ferruginibacter sp.]